jgi:hypothetical protein
MDNGQVGEELNQLSRLLFDSAARKWYGAIAFEVCAGVLAGVFSVADVSGDVALAGAAAATILLVVAYALRL